MRTATSALAVVMLLIGTTPACADALFDDFHVIKKPKKAHGYRGIMGDFLQLKDGSILMSYTDGDIMTVKSTDKGKTWGEPSVLVPRLQPPAKSSIGLVSLDAQLLLNLQNASPTTRASAKSKKNTVARTQLRTLVGSLQNGQLLAESQILSGQMTSGDKPGSQK